MIVNAAAEFNPLQFPVDSETVGAATTINAAFFQEIKDDNYELRRLLKAINKLVNHCGALSRRYRLISLLGRLRDQLAMHFALEESYGYFHNPVTVAPELSHLATSLQSQHSVLYLQILEIVEHAEYIARDLGCARLWPQVVERVRVFCDRLREHEKGEIDLIQRAFNDELGTGD